jgi:hypothetical protein
MFSAQGEGTMRQALHILQKDIAHLRWEICLVLGLAVLFAFRGAWLVEILWALAGIFLMAHPALFAGQLVRG